MNPVEASRRRRASALLEWLLVFAMGIHVVRGLARAVGPEARAGPPPAPLEIDVRTDPPWRLALLPGIGPLRAEAIIRDRERHGPPDTLEDLDRVPGIGPGTLQGLRSGRPARVVFGDGPDPGEEAPPHR